ncbi:MAG TPA: glycosyltransferase [Phycisphaerae bacterium]|nr:glycosyltransferase [Phycisphaerae bacterium]
MDERASSASDPAIFEANIAALKLFLPKSAERMLAAAPPPSARATLGRDGCLTYAWSDDRERLHWLGRTSMPSIRAAALVDAFQPGNRNVLLAGFGQGAEARLLLDRLLPHQAVMVVEEDAWAAALSLRLYDFSADFQRRRLPLFAGPDAWDALQEFLQSSDGYLTPERVLSWPWFEAKAVADVSNRLLEIGKQVARHRASRQDDRRRSRKAGAAAPCSQTIALLSNVPQINVKHLADRLSAAADSLDRPCVRFILDDPAMVHPFAVEDALQECAPGVLVLLDVAPDSLRYELPDAPSIIVCAHRHALANEWLSGLDKAVRLGVPTATQRRQAMELGLDASRVVLLPPAAWPRPDSGKPHPGDRLIVLADGANTSAEAAGLHLASHCQLWKASLTVLREHCDTYCDDQAADILDSVERKLNIRLDSQEVRAGLIDRIRRILGPALVREAYCQALAAAGFDFDLYGEGWASHPALKGYHRGPWPEPRLVDHTLQGHGLLICVEPSGCLRSVVLDALVAGLAVAVRAHPLDETGDGLSAVLDPDRHICRFQTRSELVELAGRFTRKPEEFRLQAAATAAHVMAGHTWTHRLQSILQACQAV